MSVESSEGSLMVAVEWRWWEAAISVDEQNESGDVRSYNDT